MFPFPTCTHSAESTLGGVGGFQHDGTRGSGALVATEDMNALKTVCDRDLSKTGKRVASSDLATEAQAIIVDRDLT